MKQYLYRRYPELAAASDFYSLARRMRRAGFRDTPFGFRLTGPEIMQEGRYEPEETAVIRRHLAGVDVFVDVGANVGYFSCIARAAGRHVVAVEPLLHNLEFLYGNLRANGWDDVEVFPLGLSGQPGLATLYGQGTAASLLKDWAGISTKMRTIPLSTLDTVLGTRFAGKRLLIKVDVEGAEWDVLKGAGQTLRMEPKPVWLMENGLAGYFPGGRNPHFTEVFERFWGLGYEARTIGEGGRTVSPADVRDWTDRQAMEGGSNLLFYAV